ncbi:MAG: hypothetical protein WDM71_10405 [Ferruginibacter sp.]
MYYFAAGLYAECLLDGYYCSDECIWAGGTGSKRKNLPPVKATYSNQHEWIITTSISIGGTALLYFLLRKYILLQQFLFGMHLLVQPHGAGNVVIGKNEKLKIGFY